MKKRLLLTGLLLVMIVITGCGDTAERADSPADASQNTDSGIENHDNDIDGELIFDYSLGLEYSNNFSVDFYKGGYIIFTSSASEYEFLIVPEGKSAPDDLSKEIKVLYAPLNNLYVDSSAMVSLISSYDGGLDSLKLVTTEKDDWYLDNVAAAMNTGKVSYGGKRASPDYEIMVGNQIQLCICSTMLNSNPEIKDTLTELGIPYFIETSSFEDHPLARMEWTKLMGIITGNQAAAAEAFNRQKKVVDSVIYSSQSIEPDIKVAIFYYTNDGQRVYVRNSEDYVVRMLQLAGGVYAAEDFQPGESGATVVTFEDFFSIVSGADYIFYMNYFASFTELEEFTAFNDINREFKAVQNKKVWYTSPDFSQKANALGDIIADMNKILTSGENIDTDYLIYMK